MIETLFKAVDIFKKNGIDYCLIGGLAVMLHGGRANTVDIDFYVLVDDLNNLTEIFNKENISTRRAGEHQIQATLDHIRIDCLWADQYLGHDVLDRSVEKKLGENFIRVATPEDLIVLKSLADRSIDRRDIEELRELFGKKLDEKYIEKKLNHIRKLLAE